ncbi:MAG: tRNA pseudouridine(55) synthase TruB, partial [Bacilli bacterium]
AKILLGESYDTEDITGTLLNKMVVNNVDKNKIDQVLSSLIGETEQVPPMYSAVKINGQKLYEIARKGETVERKSRTIKILNLERTSEIEEIEDKVYFDFVSKVSKGTYIRALCTRIGECLGCYASMAELVRISSGNFLLDNSSTIDDIKEGKFKIINMVEAIDLEKINLDDNTFNDVKNGKMITLNSKEALVALVYNKQLVAIYERDNQEYKAKRVWN